MSEIIVNDLCSSCTCYGRDCAGIEPYFGHCTCRIVAVEWEETFTNGFGKKQQISKCGKFVRTFNDCLQDWSDAKEIIFGE